MGVVVRGRDPGQAIKTSDGQGETARAALKFAPWELAPTALWHGPGTPFVSPSAAWTMMGYVMALTGAGWYVVSLFGRSRRTPYDRLVGTLVVRGTGDNGGTLTLAPRPGRVLS